MPRCGERGCPVEVQPCRLSGRYVTSVRSIGSPWPEVVEAVIVCPACNGRVTISAADDWYLPNHLEPS